MPALLCAVTVFLGAFLLFQVQPQISKTILPWFGGTPGVWATCMLVFQWLLFCGYAWAHLMVRFLSPRRQAMLHGALLLLAGATLQILPDAGDKPLSPESPEVQIIRILLVTVGFPFFLLSTTGPLLQSWWSRLTAGRSPYRLYALSNLGSLLALLAYPFVVEPYLSLERQASFWMVAFYAYALVCGLVAVLLFRLPDAELSTTSESSARREEQPGRVRSSTILYWFVLGCMPSVMLLATTNQVCLDIASVPFLWIIPLALYLLSFILCFGSSRWCAPRFWMVISLLSAAAMSLALHAGEELPVVLQSAVFFTGLFACSMLCHGELARRAPDARHLTLYYLVMSAAGATGGTLVGLLAPLLFNSLMEVPLAIAAMCLLTFVIGGQSTEVRFGSSLRRALRITHIAVVVLAGISLSYPVFFTGHSALLITRNFYGVLRVTEPPAATPSAAVRDFYHGRIKHGFQYLAEEKRRQPGAYYSRTSGLGLTLQTFRRNQARRIGVIGLGVGTIAAYANAGDDYCFYEIDPDVEAIARKYFTFLSDCPAECRVVTGDARLVLEREAVDRQVSPFDVLVIDAFSGDAVPTHLVTLEAIRLYLSRLTEGGLLAFHTSNRHVDLKPVLSAIARHEKLTSRVIQTRGDLEARADCEWVIMSHRSDSLSGAVWDQLPTLDETKPVLWTDNYCSLAAVIRPVSLRQGLTSLTRDRQLEQLTMQGIEELAAGRLSAAEARFRQGLEINDRNAGLWLHLGNCLRRQSRAAEAVRCYQRAVELNPDYSEGWNNLGLIVARTDPRQALELFRNALRIDPRNADAHTNLGNALARLGQLEQAVEHYQQALAINPAHPQAGTNRNVVQEMMAGKRR